VPKVVAGGGEQAIIVEMRKDPLEVIDFRYAVLRHAASNSDSVRKGVRG
jgi:hypothetical protein